MPLNHQFQISPGQIDPGQIAKGGRRTGGVLDLATRRWAVLPEYFACWSSEVSDHVH
ncbi:hypothetical protein [Novipirellula galeiformis]|uniref:hypothetical protein n=1 Tax=Novipirellula galeiformis TaxID=2528004 RepID=UPI0018CFC1E1|nr:hypothetical protein [Novipirellula galeiformis]